MSIAPATHVADAPSWSTQLPVTAGFNPSGATGAYVRRRETLADGALGDGSIVGDYELLELLGRGGMGVVYKARQRSADRIVALKVVRPELLEDFGPARRDEWLQRFRTEAHAAARIEHENAVTVYEVGEWHAGDTAAGDPAHSVQFYSMRFVEGRSLADLLDQGPLPGGRAAAYLEAVARAVHHAHTCGILHRDLKPRNILVDQHDRPYVADFGLAKLTESVSDMTHTGACLGTPSYMPPEQALDAAHITPASDTYSLGATLYDVLTGRPPFQAATPAETLHQVIHKEPVPPRQLNSAIDHDLETICLKCLQKEPGKRYATAEALADDLTRYLRGEPILARPVGRVERAWRWCRRNPLVASLSSAVCLLLLGGTAAALWTALEFRDQAEQEGLLRKDADASAKEAQQVVNDLLTNVSETDLFDEPKLQPMRLQLMEQALDYYQRFASQRTDDPLLQAELAATHFRIAEVYHVVERNDDMIAHLQSGIDVARALRRNHPAAAEAHQKLAGFWKGHRRLHRSVARPSDLPAALATCRDFIALWEVLARAYPDTPGFQSDLAGIHVNIAQLGLLGLDSFDALDESLAILERLVARYPDEPKYKADLGLTELLRSSYLNGSSRPGPDRQKSIQRALAIFEEVNQKSPQLAFPREGLGNAWFGLAAITGPPEKETALKQAARHFDSLLAEFPKIPAYREGAGEVYHALGVAHRQAGRAAAAEQAFRRAYELATALSAEFPRYDWQFRNVTNALANALRSQGQAAEADRLLAELVAHYERKVEKSSSSPELSRQLANACLNAGQREKAIAALSRVVEAQPESWSAWYYRAATYYDLGLWNECIADHAKVIEFKPDHARSWYQRAQCYSNQGKWAEALPGYERAVELGLAKEDAHVWLWKGNAHAALEQWEEAIAALTRAVEQAAGEYSFWSARGWAYQRGGQWEPALQDYFQAIVRNPHELSVIGPRLRDARRLAEAEALARQAIEEYQRRAAAKPEDPAPRDAEARLSYDLASLLQSAGELPRAEAASRQAIAVWERLAEDFPERREFLQHAAYAYHLQLCYYLETTGRSEQSAELNRNVVAPHWEKLRAAAPENFDYRLMLAQAYGRAGDWARAVAEYSAAIVVDPGHAGALSQRGGALVSLYHQQAANGERRAALKTLDELLLLNDFDPHRNDWPLCLTVAEALSDAAALAEQDAELAEAERSALAQSYLDAARQYVRDAIDRCSADAEQRNNLAWRLVRGPSRDIYEPAAVVQLCQQAVQAAPQARHIVHTLGVAQFRAGDFAAAIETLDRSLELYGGGTLGQHGFFLAMAHDKLGQAEQARDWFAASELWRGKVEPGSAELAAMRAEAAARLKIDDDPPLREPLVAEPDPAAARWADVELYSHVVSADPAAAWAWLLRGRAWSAQGQGQRAVDDLTRAIELKPSVAAAHHDRAHAYERMAQPAAALEDFNLAVELAPTVASNYLCRARLRVRQNALDEALADLRAAIQHGLPDALRILTNDPSLAPLREREDFRELLKELP